MDFKAFERFGNENHFGNKLKMKVMRVDISQFTNFIRFAKKLAVC